MASDEDYDDDLGNIPYVDGGSTLGDVIFGTPAAGEEIQEINTSNYLSIYNPPSSLWGAKNRIFIPGVPITVRISKWERNNTKHPLNPYLYTFELQHGPFVWNIYKRYKHFLALHQKLKIYRAALLIPFPTDNHKRNRQSFKEGTDRTEKGAQRGALPRFPNKPEMMIGYDEVEDRSQQLEQYLQNLLNVPFYREHPETADFIHVSYLSFVSGLGVKGVEVMVKKQTGSTQRGCCFGVFECTCCVRCSHLLSDICGCWRQRWLVVKDTWLGYVRPKDGTIRGVVLFDNGFDISSGLYTSGIQVYNMQRRIVFKCRGRRKRAEVCQMIKDISQRQGYGFTQRNKNSSYAPPRSDTISRWYVDGSSYMSAVADAIMAAKEEIFIADWWLSPEIYLKRPSLHGHEWRLDQILQKKAHEGVKIFVLLYKEVELALGLNSYYSKNRLLKCHKDNIKVLRHPDRASTGIFLWAHHEKIVCIDQTIAFLGGLDLCYGRWDDQEHRLVDCGSIQMTSENPHKRKITSSRPLGSKPKPLATLVQGSNTIGVTTLAFPGNCNGEVAEVEVTAVEAAQLEEIPLEIQLDDDDIVVEPTEENMKGDSPEFQRKSIFRKLQDTVQESSKTLLQKVTGDYEEEKPEPEPVEEPPEEAKSVAQLEGFNLLDECDGGFLKRSVKYWLGKDYCNFIVKDFCDLDSPFIDLVDRNTTPRMPWHDVGLMIHGAAARDVARHFIQRWNATKTEKAKKMTCYPYLLPKSYEHFENPPDDGGKYYRVNCQILRSVSSWSAGFLDPEMWEESIHEAYITTISKAQHYIYIENQFYISLARQNPYVKNQVGEALYKRIMRAHKEGKKFRVFVVFPLLPGFEGEVGGASGTALHAICHWNYASMCRGPDSLIGRLSEQGVTSPEDYITFHGLRNHSSLHNEPVTELVYVHSKLLIADDRYVICGSANINDRSLIGKRDSEIAALIQDEDLTDGKMNEEDALIGSYASSLRKHLFSEHLGLSHLDAELDDPVSDQFYYNVWRSTSTVNTDIYEEVFRCLPSDRVSNFKDLKAYNAELPLLTTDPATSLAKISNIKGFLVNMPLNFLKDETLTPNSKSVEGIMPTSLWT